MTAVGVGLKRELHIEIRTCRVWSEARVDPVALTLERRREHAHETLGLRGVG